MGGCGVGCEMGDGGGVVKEFWGEGLGWGEGCVPENEILRAAIWKIWSPLLFS